MPIVRKNRPPPIKTTEIQINTKRVEILGIMKYMNIDDIRKIWSESDRQVEYVTYCPIYKSEGRYVIFVISIKLKGKKEQAVDELFYRSTGTSREGSGTTGVWFPGGKPILGQKGVRLEKAEDDIIYGIETGKIKNFDHLNHGRFITELNSYVSKALYRTEPDDDDFIELNFNTSSLDEIHKLLEEKTETCKLRMIEY